MSLQSGPGRFTFDPVTGALLTSTGGGGTSAVNITQILGAAVAMNNALPVELSDGTNPFGTIANPLSVNVITGGGGVTTGVAAVVNAGNSSTTPLAGGASFTGTPSMDLTTLDYTAIQVQVLASQNGTLYIQFSTDNSNWDHTITSIVTAGGSASVATGIHGRYARVVYTNGATTQVGGYFRLQTILVPIPVSPTIKDLDTPVDSDDNALITHSLITGHTTAGGGGMVDVKVNPSGALTAAVTAAAGDLHDDIAQWGGTAVQAAATIADAGTGAMPFVRNIQRRFTQILTTTPLAGAATYTGAWFDTNSTGGVQVVVTTRADQASAAGGFFIDETDDSSDANFTKTVAVSAGTLGANTTYQMTGVVRARFWRIRYINGATLQGSFKLIATESDVPSGLISGFIAPTNNVPILQNIVTDAQGNLSVAGSTQPADSAFGRTFLVSGISSNNAIAVGSFVSTGAGSGQWNMLRTPTTFKTATATASGNTAVWTPTTGKKFRLMRYKIEIPQDAVAASGADLDVTFQDSTTDVGVGHTCFIPAAAATTFGPGYSSEWIDLGNGKLSAAANNVLNINLSFALTGSKVRVTVCGTEE